MTSNGMPSPNPKNYFISPLPPDYCLQIIMTLFPWLFFPSVFPTLKKKKTERKENLTLQITSANKCIHFHFNTLITLIIIMAMIKDVSVICIIIYAYLHVTKITYLHSFLSEPSIHIYYIWFKFMVYSVPLLKILI